MSYALISPNFLYDTKTSSAFSLMGSANGGKSLRDRRREKRNIQRSNIENMSKLPNRQITKSSGENSTPSIYQTPYDLRDDVITNEHVKFYSLDDLFPGKNLGMIFDKDEIFRRKIRLAAREDFFVYDPKLSDKANAILKDPGSTLMSNWQMQNDYNHLSRVFSDYNIDITGKLFITILSDLCTVHHDHEAPITSNIFGSWIDIIGVKNRKVNYSWHQDSGLNQNTVMMGFPPSNHYHGEGVFSHVFKLSHRMTLPAVQSANEPRLWSYGPIPEECIVRPIYCKGCEVMVYNDRDVFHSA
eukprot:CAMPEP_0182431196 /NCGR_PEP_ID=MMETSP1167-20130531/47189_1 /TAXON_ID=2988 /ORGANISM="Mallomonas Sp, Strain CCMP3275" /LENGTH=299 /DNA_ID=CAMNT_0024617255 /DNA_START=323 /DNA_END=1219 /DNA_ORIENTATION=-